MSTVTTEETAIADTSALLAVTSATAALDAAMFDRNREGFTDITALVDAFAAARAAAAPQPAKPDTPRRTSTPPPPPPTNRPPVTRKGGDMSTAIINLEETAPRQLSGEERSERVRRLATWAAAELAHAKRLPRGRVRSGHLTNAENALADDSALLAA